MKLLFDQNLSAALVQRLEDLFPQSQHVKLVGMMTADDVAIWEYAKENELVIVSKDTDFHQRSLLYGVPPKVVWLGVGNCPTLKIEKIIRENSVVLHTFERDPVQSLLILT